MLPEQLPSCVFGHKNWRPNGASLGPGYDQEWFICQDCGLTAFFLSEEGGNVFLVLERLDGDQLPKPISSWIDDTLRISWRANAAKIKSIRGPIEAHYWDIACEAVGVPPKTSYYDVAENEREQFREISDGYQNDSYWLNPEGVVYPFIPPRLPVGVVGFVIAGRNGEKFNWRWVSHEETAELEVPPDPIRVQHDVLFSEIFQTLRNELKISFTPEEIPNRYHPGWKPEPWFRFQVGKNTFVVGPRKRVYAIIVESPSGLQTKGIRKVALDEDNVTYSPNGNWHGTDSVAKSLEVHAWSKEKLIQYLTIMGRASLPVQVK